jgi:hypothetical protein
MALKAMADSRRQQKALCMDCKKAGDSHCFEHQLLCHPETFKSLSKTWELGLCPREKDAIYHKKACIYGDCEICKDRSNMEKSDYFKWTHCEKGEDTADPNNAALFDLQIKVQMFGYITCIDPISKKPLTNDKGKARTRVGLEVKEMSVPQLAEHFISTVLEIVPVHQFQAMWMHDQFKNNKNPWILPLGQCVHVMDFSENPTLLVCWEVQSQHWHTVQISLHIGIVYRHAVLAVDGVESTADNPIIVKDVFVFTSDDTTHDFHFVHEVQRVVYTDHYRKLGIVFTKVNEWTDQCAGQYKCQNVYGDLAANWKSDFGIPIDRFYFEVDANFALPFYVTTLAA